jgi:hypothetical protein
MDLGLDVEAAAQVAMIFGVVSFIREPGANAGHNREGGRKQPREGKRVVEVRRCRDAGDRYAVSVSCDRVLGALLAAIGRVGAGAIAAALGAPRAAAIMYFSEQLLYVVGMMDLSGINLQNVALAASSI